MNITVIIPTYNEKVNIQKLIPILENEVFSDIKNHQMSILVADDKSPDGTADEVRKMMKKWKNIDLLVGEKEGLGAAYIRAMRYAMDEMKADAVVELDADFQHDPHDIIRFVREFDNGYDYVIGSRYIKEGKIPEEWGLHRKFLSFFGSLFARFVLFMPSIHDITSGYKLTRTSYLQKVDLDNLFSKYYAYKIHILFEVVKLGAKVKEVPIIFYERTEGSSKISRKDFFDSFSLVIRLRIRESKKFIKFLMVGGVGFILNAITLAILVDGFLWHPAYANLVGAVFAIFSNFNFNNAWTFKERKTQNRKHYILKLMQFYATSAFGVIVIQTGTIYLGTHTFGRELYFLYFLFGTFLLLIWNFTIYNKFIWKK